MLALTLVVWLGGLAALLAVANRVHNDVPQLLAIKLPLLKSKPSLIFAGESRTEYGVDPELAAQLLGQPAGSVVNIAYDGGEPLAVLGAARDYPDVFQHAHVLVSVAPFIFNDGVRSAGVYPQDVAARLGVVEQLWSFLPLRVGTLIRYIREAFAARLAADQQLATRGQQPPHQGLSILTTLQREDRYIARLADHPHYANWNLSGPRTKYETEALCDLARRSQKLTVVMPPWAPRYDPVQDPAWVAKDAETEALLEQTGHRCGFDVLTIRHVPGLDMTNYADEMHVNVTGVPIYTRYLVMQLKR